MRRRGPSRAVAGSLSARGTDQLLIGVEGEGSRRHQKGSLLANMRLAPTEARGDAGRGKRAVDRGKLLPAMHGDQQTGILQGPWPLQVHQKKTSKQANC